MEPTVRNPRIESALASEAARSSPLGRTISERRLVPVPSRNSVAGNGIFGCGDWRPKQPGETVNVGRDRNVENRRQGSPQKRPEFGSPQRPASTNDVTRGRPQRARGLVILFGIGTRPYTRDGHQASAHLIIPDDGEQILGLQLSLCPHATAESVKNNAHSGWAVGAIPGPSARHTSFGSRVAVLLPHRIPR
jgi:hypothetical protein